jgi:hypothetical protein
MDWNSKVSFSLIAVEHPNYNVWYAVLRLEMNVYV